MAWIPQPLPLSHRHQLLVQMNYGNKPRDLLPRPLVVISVRALVIQLASALRPQNRFDKIVFVQGRPEFAIQRSKSRDRRKYVILIKADATEANKGIKVTDATNYWLDMGFQRKRPRIECTAENLPWKKSRRPLETILGGDDGILELEEVEGVEVIYTTTTEGKVAKFRVSSPSADSHSQSLCCEVDPQDDVQEIQPPEILAFNCKNDLFLTEPPADPLPQRHFCQNGLHIRCTQSCCMCYTRKALPHQRLSRQLFSLSPRRITMSSASHKQSVLFTSLDFPVILSSSGLG